MSGKWDDNLKRLRGELATLYETEGASRMIVDDAGLDSGDISFCSKAEENWHAILLEANKHNKVINIIKRAREKFGDNEVLIEMEKLYEKKIANEHVKSQVETLLNKIERPPETPSTSTQGIDTSNEAGASSTRTEPSLSNVTSIQTKRELALPEESIGLADTMPQEQYEKISVLFVQKYLHTKFSEQALTLMYPQTSLAMLNEAAEEAYTNYKAILQEQDKVVAWDRTLTNKNKDASGRNMISAKECDDLKSVLDGLEPLLEKEGQLFRENDALRAFFATDCLACIGQLSYTYKQIDYAIVKLDLLREYVTKRKVDDVRRQQRVMQQSLQVILQPLQKIAILMLPVAPETVDVADISKAVARRYTAQDFATLCQYLAELVHDPILSYIYPIATYSEEKILVWINQLKQNGYYKDFILYLIEEDSDFRETLWEVMPKQ